MTAIGSVSLVTIVQGGRNANHRTVVRGHDLGTHELAHTMDFEIRFHRE